MGTKKKRSPWVTGLWVALGMVVLIGVVVIINASGAGWNFSEVLSVPIILVYSVMIVFAYLLGVACFWSLIKAAVIGLTILTFLFLFASMNEGLFADEVRSFISNTFKLDYLVAGITFLALLLAVASLNKDALEKKE